MDERVCYFNGEYVGEDNAKVSIVDWGFREGGVYEITRTYDRIPFRLDEHVDRLFRSLRCLPFIQISLTPREVKNVTLELLKRNETCLGPEDDYSIIYRVTRDTLCIHMSPLSSGRFSGSYESMAKLYRYGAHLVVASTRQIPPQCLDPKIKHTNRLCNDLADYEAKMVDPGAFALMLDINGVAAECPTHNFFLVKEGRLFTPSLSSCLPGVSRQVVLELANELDIEHYEKDIYVYDLYNADEIILTATSFAIVPVSKFNSIRLPAPVPGPITVRLQSAFSRIVGYDIVQRVLDYVVKKE